MQDTLFRSRRETRGKRLGCGKEDSRDVIPGGEPRRSRCTNSIHDASVLLLPFLLQICYGFTGRGLYYPGRSDLFELSVIHLNDFHARFEQTGPRSEACHEGEEKDCVGGISRVSTAVNRLMNERPNLSFVDHTKHVVSIYYMKPIFSFHICISRVHFIT